MRRKNDETIIWQRKGVKKKQAFLMAGIPAGTDKQQWFGVVL